MGVIGKNIKTAAAKLREGGIVAIPTETVYGLAANALDTKAVLKVFEAKQRPLFDPLILHVDSLERAFDYAEFDNTKLLMLAKTFWPGSLTLLVKKKPNVPYLITSGLDRVAIRVPNHPVALEILRQLDFPLAAPSANPFGYISPTTAKHVDEQLGNLVDYILDGDNCSIGIESTIVGEEGGRLIVYRLGGIAVEQLEEVCGKLEFSLNKSSNPKAPGQLKSHYAPRKKMKLTESPKDLVKANANCKIAYLGFSSKIIAENVVASLALSESGDVAEAAKNLFSFLRELDHSEAELIIAEKLPGTFLGRAVNDRLERASAE